MLNNEQIKSINHIHNCMTNGLVDDLMITIRELPSQEIAEELLNDDVLPQNESLLTYNEALRYFIDFCSYVENETDEPAVISDELYDSLVEKLIDLGETQPIGSIMVEEDDEEKLPHLYPELRGSLAKVHFIKEEDIPEKDSRKSIEGYFKNVVRQMKNNNLPIGKIKIGIDMKYDGVSQILECNGTHINHILTRGDVDTNLGKDLTPLFKQFFYGSNGEIDSNMLFDVLGLENLPEELIYDDFMNYGIKVEDYMHTYEYEQYKEKYNVKRCNRRSAVVSICNQDADGVKKYDIVRDYLNMRQFQIASEKPIPGIESCKGWYYIGTINERHQYLYMETELHEVDLNDIDSICNLCSEMIDSLKDKAEEVSIPIDGIVISIMNQDIIRLLGRANDKNMFQVAFKFPAGEEKTIVEKVDFQVGPIAGQLTPVARLKPIKINGNTITNVTISNKAKMERLQIHEGDEVLIKYDIIPTIFKDKTCKCSNKPLITFPTNCPVCDGEVVDERCTNPDCPAKTVGHVLNFVKKNRIGGGIGYKTIVDLVDRGFIHTIGDLYRLYQNRESLCNIPGYGETSIDSILKGISESRKLYPHQVFGAIGIPNIGLKTMEKICRNIDLIGCLDKLEELLDPLTKISGIGSRKAIAALEGIEKKLDIIKDICSNVELLIYPKEENYEDVICFTNIRDDEFEKFLMNHNVLVSDTFNSKVTMLVVPNEPMSKPSKKLLQAQKKGIEIITMKEAKDKYNYER